MSAIHVNASEEDLLVLMPPHYGDIANIDCQSVETIYLQCLSYADGVVHCAAYKDGLVKMMISTTTPSTKKEIGNQIIFRDGKEISQSNHYFLDEDKPNTVIHVHDRYIVYTSSDKQTIVPR